MTRTLFVIAFVAVAGLMGCASAGTGNSVRTDSRVITQAQLEAAGAGNAYDVIRRLRPNFFTTRGEVTLGNASASPYPNIYVNGLMYGDINSLRNLDSGQLAEVRLYQAYEAQAKFGMGNNNGVIAITTRK